MTEPRTFYNAPRGQEIVSRLHAIEQSHNVRVLYAIESGSRAWGFASPNSDWDVRFLYVHPEDWYLSVHEQRDVIELPIDGDLDINGWDLRKALRLLLKGNPVLFEWLHSPILYLEGRSPMSGLPVMDDVRRVAMPLFNSTAAVYHYWHMAKGNFREYLQGDTVRMKKYFYVLRPVLACQWVLRGLGQPPMGFGELVHELVPQGALLDEIHELLRLKTSAEEMALGPARPAIQRFLEESLLSIEQVAGETTRPVRKPEDIRDVDRFFRAIVRSREWSAC
jgi:predicted nucleotidyltransferase